MTANVPADIEQPVTWFVVTTFDAMLLKAVTAVMQVPHRQSALVCLLLCPLMQCRLLLMLPLRYLIPLHPPLAGGHLSYRSVSGKRSFLCVMHVLHCVACLTVYTHAQFSCCSS